MRAKSIPVEKLAELAGTVARDVLAERRRMPGDDLAIGFFPDIGTVGPIARRADLSQLTATELPDLSTRIAKGMADLAPAAEAIAQITDGGITVGYYPAGPTISRQVF